MNTDFLIGMAVGSITTLVTIAISILVLVKLINHHDENNNIKHGADGAYDGPDHNTSTLKHNIWKR